MACPPCSLPSSITRISFAYDLSSLRTGIMAGAPCPIETMRRVVSQMHMREVTIGYGMTETSPISFQSSVDDPLERRVSTVGRIHPACRGQDRRYGDGGSCRSARPANCAPAATR